MIWGMFVAWVFGVTSFAIDNPQPYARNDSDQCCRRVVVPLLRRRMRTCVPKRTTCFLQLSGLPRLLPSRGDNLVPDIEHTLLQPLSLLMLLAASACYRTLEPSSSHLKLLLLSTVVLAGTQLAFVFLSETPTAELGPMLVTMQVQ